MRYLIKPAKEKHDYLIKLNGTDPAFLFEYFLSWVYVRGLAENRYPWTDGFEWMIHYFEFV